MRFYSMAIRNLKEIYRDPVTLLLGLGLPVALLLLFSSIHESTQLEMFTPQFLAPGIVVFSYAFLLMFCAILIAKDRQSSFLIRMFTTPLKPSDYILSYILPFVPIAISQTVICLLVGVILGASFTHLIGGFLVLMLFAVSCISLGVVIGSLFSVNQVSGIGSLLITAISLFSGAWMDLKLVGGVFESIGYVLPFANALEASRALLNGSNLADVSDYLRVVAIYTGILFVLAIVSFRWSMKRL